tara:strand:- start:2110 stop:2445 length:336 start_codon:yes stop_codon:yes gene_type:complete
MVDERATEMTAEDRIMEINRGLYVWWGKNQDEALSLATQVVEFCAQDCYVDDIMFEENAPYGVTIRILILEPMSTAEPKLEIAIPRLRDIFGCEVDLWCCSSEKHLGDSVG